MNGAFEQVPANPAGHFVLNLYAAIYRLLQQTRTFAELGGSSLEDIFERYPFLGDYFAEMRQQMPDDITWEDAAEWWRVEIAAWERACKVHLPLRALSEQANLSFANRLAFMIIGLVEEDSRFGTLIAELQEPLSHRRPTLELAGQMIMDTPLVGESDPWSLCRPLIGASLVEVQNRAAPRSEWLLRVPPLLWDAVRGEVDARPASWCRLKQVDDFVDPDALIFPDAFVARVAQIPQVLREGRARVVVLRTAPGRDAEQIAGAVARAMNKPLIEVHGDDLADGETKGEATRLVGPLAALVDGLPCFTFELGPGETARLPHLTGYTGPAVVVIGDEGGLATEINDTSITLTVPAPDGGLRRRLWHRAVGDDGVRDLDRVVDGFHLGGGFIRTLARSAQAQATLDGRQRIAIDDVREASCALNRQLLDTLASHMPSKGAWQDLVTGAETRIKLGELERRCRYREQLLDRLGPAFSVNGHRGVRALFTGASGTGKTLAARILASVLGMDLYRVDLAAVVNKYIGETEKNLHQVLSRAESLDVVLLLDEGDALLGQRTDVKSANDRYANLETNYLLQRLEHYQGIVLTTTNLGDNIDQAFQRRMDVVVPFLPPQPEERLQILELHLPTDHGVSIDFMETIALRCQLTGSQIRNAVLHATLLALDEDATLVDRHLDVGVHSEYRKAGGLCPLDRTPGNRPVADVLDACLAERGLAG